DWVKHNGDSFFRRIGDDAVLGTRADIVELTAGWGFDSRDRVLFPTHGALHHLQLTTTPPGSPIEYATATYQYQQFLRLPLPVLRAIPFSFDAHVSYAPPLGDTPAIPPNRHFFGG